ARGGGQHLRAAGEPLTAASGAPHERRALRCGHPGPEGRAQPAHHQSPSEQAAPCREPLLAPPRSPQLLHGGGSARPEPGRAALRAHRTRRHPRPRSDHEGLPRMTAPAPTTSVTGKRVDLRKFAWLSIVAAILTITLKTGAWVMTD